jgi:hypothetical protein
MNPLRPPVPGRGWLHAAMHCGRPEVWDLAAWVPGRVPGSREGSAGRVFRSVDWSRAGWFGAAGSMRAGAEQHSTAFVEYGRRGRGCPGASGATQRRPGWW